MSFQKLQVASPILDALREKGYTQPTPIQEQAIPAILSGRDVLACAQTGTGKTASFSIPLLQRLSATKSSGNIRGLILSPTRELAIQISDNLTLYGKNLSVTSTLVYGGVSMFDQIKKIRKGTDIIIATPGRLMDLINQKVVRLQDLDVLILDEADRMLDMGFIQVIKKILALIPRDCQRIFLSATMPDEIQKLVAAMLHDPITIKIKAEPTVAKIMQAVYYVTRDKKRALLKHVITEQKMRNVIVFARTKHGVDKIAKDLIKSGISAEAFHGDKSQGARQRALSNFKGNTTRVLVATDIAARGIDIIDLPFVINYEMPDTIETYTHRIGRTGRAGNLGTALSFCDHEEKGHLTNLNRISPGKIQVLKHPFA